MPEKKKKKNQFVEMEEKTLDFWEKNEIFEKSVKKEAPQGDYVFYDGPPFATGTPHYGHLVASIMKDSVPRFWTMKGYKVERVWGWDCHGLPIENIVEKELKTESKKDIEKKIGIEKFNESCRSKVLEYAGEWKKTVRRMGRWVDMENAYKTMDVNYMESIWAIFKKLWDNGLVYKDYRSMHVCPRCETTLSQSEVTEGYKDVKDLSVVAKFELVDQAGKGKTYILAWTTTPWTLPGNVALAVGEDISYKILEVEENNTERLDLKKGDKIIIASSEETQTRIFGEILNYDAKSKNKKAKVAYKHEGELKFKNIKDVKGNELIGKSYKPLFDNYFKNNDLKNKENGWKIYHADFVTTEEGTGVVHIAPAFGDDDMNMGKEYDLPFVQHVKMDGDFTKEMGELAGANVKPKDNLQQTDVEIIKYLARKELLFSKEKYEHSYPHCWRCDTPLINYATSSWFVNITKIKKEMLETAKEINWSPKHIKKGRFGKWLEGARDWSISRQRFWASVIPIWECSCKERKVIGSVDELEKLSGKKITDLHKHVVDKVVFKCEKCGGKMHRIPDVFDCWFESGSMPYAQIHYPFENKDKIDNPDNFPAQFIAEGSDQTRAWFYYLHVIANGIKETHAFKNVIVNGIVLAEDGKKMSKKLKNYPDPNCMLDAHGADALRYYLLTSPVMMAENLNFSEKGVIDTSRKLNNILWNVYKFYEMYCHFDRSDSEVEKALKVSEGKKVKGSFDSANASLRMTKRDNVLDKWIVARLNQLIKEVTEGMEKYDLPRATRPVLGFIDDFSTWYLRRSRDRFKTGDDGDKKTALKTMSYVFLELSKVLAPFTPFIAETLWQKVTGNDFEDENKSVHLEAWPSIDVIPDSDRESSIIEEMEQVRKVVEMGLAKRDEAGIRVRQPLSELRIKNYELRKEYLELIKDELNIKKVFCKTGKGALALELALELTPELLEEGAKREVVRFINAMRKANDLTIGDKIEILYKTDSADLKKAVENYKEDIIKDTLATSIKEGDEEINKEVEINKNKILLSIKKL